MRIIIKYRVLFWLLIFIPAISLLAQKKDPDEILNKVKETFAKVKDYQVDVHIKVDVDFLKAPESDATIYFKQPDKLHVESEKFVLLPKKGLSFFPLSIFNGNYTALYAGEDTVRGVPTSIVKVIPLREESEIVLSTLWIDTERNIILKIISTVKPSGTFTIDFYYDGMQDEFLLPNSMVFTFTIDRIQLPRGMDGTIDSDERDDKNQSERSTGKVYLTYSNYRINKGLPDELFED